MKKADLKKIAFQLAKEANINMRRDCLSLIKKAYQKEKLPLPKEALKIILKNASTAKSKHLPICQDTGLPLTFVEIPEKIVWKKELVDKINEGIKESYKKNCLRASSVYPFSDNTAFNPQITHIEFTKSNFFSLTVFPKGFGSENKSRLRMFNPTASRNEITDFIIDSVKKAGPEACPPFFIGVGIGGTSDYALLLAKKALLEDVTKPNPDKMLNRWEKEILKKVNKLAIGPMGFGGGFTALSVKIKMSPTHIAGLPVGINISCYALRSATVSLDIRKIKVV